MGVYYWKTNFSLDSIEKQFVDSERLEKLYCRFFDIDWNKQQQIAFPVASINWNERPNYYEVTPVVFIKNIVFEKISSDSLSVLAEYTISLIEQIAETGKLKIATCQFDCDWTVGTKDKYFSFLNKVKAMRPIWELQATIRLHQIKYQENSGIPPVERGVLMYYNMGKISSDYSNSILDNEIGAKYLDQLNKYPISLNLALPVFSWAIHIRNQSVVQLISQWDEDQLLNDSVFHKIDENRYLCIQSGYYSGAYLRKEDEIKLEKITKEGLTEASRLLSKNYPSLFDEVIFFELDSKHISKLNDAFYDEFLIKE